jgi:hypothetical protein
LVDLSVQISQFGADLGDLFGLVEFIALRVCGHGRTIPIDSTISSAE